MNHLKECIPIATDVEPLSFSDDELYIRKIRAGWSKELDDQIMQPLFKYGKDKIVSMGDQRPIEALVRKSHFDFGALFKGKFSQVTNPPLDSKREKEYMSARTFVGRKPAIDSLGKALTNGFLLSSPIVNNHEMALLMQNKVLHTHTLDIIFPIKDREAGLRLTIEKICTAAIEQVVNGTTFLVLSDLKIDEANAAIPPTIITSFVHDALLKTGLRKQVTIALQSASTITPRDVAQVISIGGVDVVNPYLPFIPGNDVKDIEEFRKKCRTYQDGLCDELLGIMARVGVSTVSAYRGTKAFNGYGLNDDLAKALGIRSDLGGVGLSEIATMTITQHELPKPEGFGRLNANSDREKIWDELNTRAFIDRARGKRDNSIESRMDLLKRGSPRGQFFLSPPKIWTEENTMPICILGGGAAGFYQAQSLLETGLPIRIIMIEKNSVNRFGLVGDGIAPDHMGTKNQARILREVLNNPHVNYYGGIEVGKDVSLNELKAVYPCIVDCRGASIDIKLNIPGENSKRVVSASTVYKGYNNAFDPLQKAEHNWPFFHNSKNPEIGIIGNGNVAADMARIFLKDLDLLKKTNISPRFLSLLENDAPDCVRIFARSTPNKTKISINELEQLKELKDVWLTATYDETKMNVSQFSEDEKKLYAFFLSIRDRKPPATYTKRLYFHFNCTPKAFEEKGNEIEAIFTGANQIDYKYRARTFITSLGSQSQSLEQLDENQLYASGWVMGRGGKLSSAEKSAEETTEKIKKNFIRGVFHHTKSPAKEQAWQLQSPVHNKEQENILHYFEKGFTIESIADFHRAKQYHQPSNEMAPVAAKKTEQLYPSFATPIKSLPTPEENKIIVYDPVTEQSHSYAAMGDETLLSVLKKDNNAPSCQCDGDQQCGECVVEVINNPVEITKKEKKLIEANGKNPNQFFLSCAHTMSELSLRIIVSPKEMKVTPKNN